MIGLFYINGLSKKTEIVIPAMPPSKILIYFFDYPTVLCMYRILKRSIKGKFFNVRRIDLAEGCKDRFPDGEFIRYVWRYNKISRPHIFSVLEEINFDRNNLIIFKNRKEFKDYLQVFECDSLL